MAEGLDLPEIVRRTAQANARFYKGWLDLSFEYFRGLSEILGGAPSEDAGPVQEADAGAGTLVLEGEAGAVVKGSFTVSNDMEKPVSCVFTASDFRDPRGAPVTARAAFDPASLQLKPGEEQVVQMTIAIDDALTPGVGYAGEISVKGMDGFSVPVVLRRQHRVEESPIDREPERDVGSADSGAPRAPRSKRGTKGGTRKRAAR